MRGWAVAYLRAHSRLRCGVSPLQRGRFLLMFVTMKNIKKQSPSPSGWERLFDFALEQEGHFTFEQALEAGYTSPQLLALIKSQRIEKIYPRVYRITRFRPGDHDQLVALWLWSYQEAVFSHETALALHDLSDVLPNTIHCTLPVSRKRIRSPVGVKLHFADIPQSDRSWRGNIPVTSAPRTLNDCADALVAPELIRQALDQGHERHLFSEDQVRRAIRYVDSFQTPPHARPVHDFLDIRALDVERWADVLESRSRLPKLIRQLILATVDRVHSLRFPADEATQEPGWDGRLEVEQAGVFVPAGLSLWELSTDKDVAKKALEDYTKRVANAPDPAATFIFVTARRWPKKDTQATKWRQQKKFRDVRILDATDLETWLGMAPAVARWFWHVQGTDFDGLWNLEEYLATRAERLTGPEEWQALQSMRRPELRGVQSSARPFQVSPQQLAELLVSGRQEAKQRVLKWVQDVPSPLRVRADTREEALLFVVATLFLAPEPERSRLLSRALVIRDERWDSLTRRYARGGLILLPALPEPDSELPSSREHHVLVPLNNASPPPSDRDGMSLAPFDRQALAKGLEALDLPSAVARQLADKSGGQWAALRRLAGDTGLSPRWAKPEEAHAFLPLLLAGDWDPREPNKVEYREDRRIIELLADGVSWKEQDRLCKRWASEWDAPIRQRQGEAWGWRSHLDAWLHLGRYVGDQELKRFEQALQQVLGENDPKFDRPPDERLVAGAFGYAPRYSHWLREGLARSLAILATRREPLLKQAHVGQAIAERFFNDTLTPHWKMWASLERLLPTLAEAAPDAFLIAAQRSIRDPVGLHLIIGQAEFLSSWHAGILWALERLAWIPEYLEKVVLVLGEWALKDTTSRTNWANRPRASLESIFRFWLPQTSASPEKRLEALDTLVKHLNKCAAADEVDSDFGWRLRFDLLPTRGSHIGDRNPRPEWHEYPVPPGDGRATWDEIGRFVDPLIDRVLEAADGHIERWGSLLDCFQRSPLEFRERIVEGLEAVGDGLPRQDIERVLWPRLRQVLYNLRRFPEKEDASASTAKELMSEAEGSSGKPNVYARLEQLYTQWTPADPAQRHGWVFGDTHNIPEEDESWEEYGTRLEIQRHRALEEVLTGKDAFDTLLRLTEEAPRARGVGLTLGARSDGAVWFERLLKLDLGATAHRRELVVGYTLSRVASNDVSPSLGVVSRLFHVGQSEVALEALLALFPQPAVWDVVDGLAPELRAQYWARVSPTEIRVLQPAIRFVEALLAAGRPEGALEVASYAVSKKEVELPADLLERILVNVHERITESHAPQNSTMFTYEIEKVLDALVAAGLPAQQMLDLELRFFPWLRDSARGPTALWKALESDPDSFAQLIEWQYISDSERQRRMKGEPASYETSGDAQARAQFALYALDSWKDVLGEGRLGRGRKRRQPWPAADGKLDEALLQQWVDGALEACRVRDRIHRGTYQVGEILARVGPGTDGIWPCEVARRLLEQTGYEELEQGLRIGRYNSRGVRISSVGQSGQVEKEEATRLKEEAGRLRDWPRTAALLRDYAAGLEADAKRSELREEEYRDP